jgi:hypothetical protein
MANLFRKQNKIKFFVCPLVLACIQLAESQENFAMMDNALLLMSIGAVAYRLIALGLDRASRFKERTLEEVFDFVYPLTNQDANALFSAKEEEEVAQFWQTKELYQEEQGRRLGRAQAYILRRQHNALIIEQWANTEWSDMRKHSLQDEAGPDLIQAILEVKQAARAFRMASSMVLVKISFWSLLRVVDKCRLFPAPNIAGLRRTGRLDLLTGYQAVRETALALASFYGAERFALLQSLI